SYNDTGLTNGWNYVYEVAAVNVNGEGPKSISDNATPSTKPGTPTGLTAIAGNANISLSWTAPSDGGSPITGYNIYRNGSLYDSVVGPVTSYNDTGLTNGWNYVYEVAAVNVNGEGPKSISDDATPSTKPGTPTGLTAIAGNANVSLSWVAPSDGGSAITGYNIYRNGSIYDSVVGPVTSYNDTGLTNGWNYVYEVAAINDNGEGPRSSSANATPSTKPGPPTALIATAGDSQVQLNWTAPLADGGSPITGYNIYRNGSFLDTVGAGITSYLDTAVLNGNYYSYQVQTNNTNGVSPFSNEQTVQPLTTPDPPESFTAVYGDSKVDLSWSAPIDDGGSPITQYRIYRSTTSGSYGAPLITLGGAVYVYSDTTAMNGIQYYYQITAVNSKGEGSPASEVNAIPRTVPDAPVNLVAIRGNTHINLTWEAPRIMSMWYELITVKVKVLIQTLLMRHQLQFLEYLRA
ncbi:MAG: fibronectin type III domain-containing protein, partial [Candidatus Kariarchaeaceae archaeon]